MPALAGAATADTGSSTSLSSFAITNPSWTGSATPAGHVVVLYAVLRGTSTFTTPSGFTAGTALVFSSTTAQVFWKVTNGTEGSTFTVAYSAAGIATACVISYSGADTSAIFDPSAPAASGTTGTGTLPAAGITTVHSGDQLVWFGASKCALATDTPGTITPPSGFTSRVTQHLTTAASSPNMTSLVADMTQAAAGATGTETGTTTNATEHDVALLVAIPAAPAAAGTPLAGARRTAARTPALPPARRFRALVPPQPDAPFPAAELRQQRQPRGMQPCRPRQFTVVPPQLNPPYPFAETAQRRQAHPRGLPRRGRLVSPVPPQLNPPYPFGELRQQRQPRGFQSRRGHGFTPVPAQQAAVPAPAWVPQSLRRARLLLPLRRRAPAPVPAVQDVPPQAARRARPVLPPRRGRLAQVPQAQAAVPPPAWVQPHRGPARAIALIRRRFRQLMPWPQAVQPPFSIGALTASDAASAALTAAGSSAALTAAAAAQGTLTAGTQTTGGPS